MLDAPGASMDDARARLLALRAAGAAVRAAVVEPRDNGAIAADRPHTRLVRVGPDRPGLGRLAGLLRQSAPDLTLIASAAAGGGAPAGQLPRGAEARWWATGVAPAAHSLARMVSRPPRPLAAADPGGNGDRCAGALLWSASDRRARGRGRLPLWDGDYVLALQALVGEAGVATLETFAAAARDRYELELVVLADPQPEFERLARRMGLGPRVHFAGPATAEAWRSWLFGASAALIGGERLSAGAVLRALACGCPLIACGETPATAALRSWLVPHGAAVDAAAPAGGGPGATLERVLEREPDCERAIAAGQSLAERLTPEALALRLATALPELEGRRRAA